MAYPLKLDMGQFLPPVNGKAVEEWYDLRGVLMHKGTSAHHGHYVAQVRDGRSVNLIRRYDQIVHQHHLFLQY